jgi:hypothetical protein
MRLRGGPGELLTGRKLAWIAIGLTALAWAGLSAQAQSWTTDDAFISFRYALNLVDGLGLVFNDGERVEGDSSFLWTLWSSAGLGAAAHAGRLALCHCLPGAVATARTLAGLVLRGPLSQHLLRQIGLDPVVRAGVALRREALRGWGIDVPDFPGAVDDAIRRLE